MCNCKVWPDSYRGIGSRDLECLNKVLERVSKCCLLLCLRGRVEGVHDDAGPAAAAEDNDDDDDDDGDGDDCDLKIRFL